MRYLFHHCKDTPLCLTSPPVPTTFAGEPKNGQFQWCFDGGEMALQLGEKVPRYQ